MLPNTLLNAITTPLNTTCLIQASAGTGKTYTISSLYLRLLLQAGEQCFERALRVEEILVVTFTEAATEELRRRIRQRIYATKNAFLHYQQEKQQKVLQGSTDLEPLKQHLFADDPFLLELLSAVEDQLDLAIERLTLAEQTMDLAAICTIHSFCRQMLMQYAFHSGVYFQFDLLQDSSDVLENLTEQFWREHFYPQPLVIANYLYHTLGSPRQVFHQLKSHFHHSELSGKLSSPELLKISLSQFLQEYILPYQQQIIALKTQWIGDFSAIQELILAELSKSYKTDEKKSLPRRTFQLNRTQNWLAEIQAWAEDPLNCVLPEKLTKYFSQTALNNYAESGATPIQHSLFQQVDELVSQFPQQELYNKILFYRYLQGVQQAFLQYKLQHNKKDFNDLLRLLHQALYGEQGEQLAYFIRYQYPFAMIDEFQDTDYQQYSIFARIYMQAQEKATACGFMMIGDPKQAIYKFRGADIFTYFKAAQEAKVRLTLNKNWRSEQSLINSVNCLFGFNQGLSFIYPQIPFTSVLAKPDQAKFILNDQIEPALRCYIFEAKDNTLQTQRDVANICANSIQHWLVSAAENQAVFRSAKHQTNLQAERIAVLVRNRYEAASIQQALQRLNIASVYLSDDSNLFASQVAQDLAWILAACLNPFNERYILNAIGSRLWGLSLAEMSQIKQDELRWTNVIERFVRYQQRWLRQGVLVMLHRLFLREKISEKLLEKVGGERDLTDLLHLAELLQQASRLNESPASLLRWFEKQLQGEANQEERIRLESENQLVKIVTIHKSKGLEYDLVWLPFIANPVQQKTGLFATYYDEQKQHIQLDIEGLHQDKVWQETQAEEMRLLYVALTRAKYQVAMALPSQFKTGWNALQYALTQGELSEQEVRSLLQEFKQRLMDPDSLRIESASSFLNQVVDLSPQTATENLDYSHFSGQIEQNWHITSFTALTYLHDTAFNAVFNQAQSAVLSPLFLGRDNDELANNSSMLISEKNTSRQIDYPQGYSPLDLPAGRQTGQRLHKFLEKLSFNRPVDREQVVQLCQQLQLQEQWIEPIQLWFSRILQTPLLPNEAVCLAHLSTADCLKELEFYLQLKQDFNVEAFNQILAEEYPQAEPLQLDREGQPSAKMKGLLRGFIDLVFRHNGKYYIVDYKSNLISQRVEDYSQQNLYQVILQQHYHWQYLFYTLAVHRYLSLRDANYQYHSHFGGVIYPFLRAMDGKQHHSVYVVKPSETMIDQLGELF